MRILTTILFLTASFSAFSNKMFEVINGYTLEPMTGFSVNTVNDKMVALVHGSIIKVDMQSGEYIDVMAEGFITQRVDYSQGETIILEPSGELLTSLLRKEGLSPEQQNYENTADSVDTEASFPGDRSAMTQFLGRTVRYPEEEINNEIQGKIYLKFVVETDGQITNISILKGGTRGLNAESIRVVKLMPKWIPATKDGKTVRSVFTLPIAYKMA